MRIKRGDVYYVNLGDEGIGSEVRKSRPCVIVQNDIGNRFSQTTIICPITHRTKNTEQPTQIVLNEELVEGKVNGVILAEQLRVIDKKRIYKYAGKLTKKGLSKLDKAMTISIGV